MSIAKPHGDGSRDRADEAYHHDTPINREAADFWRTPESTLMYEDPPHTYNKDSFDWHEGDILLASFPRCGNHMIWNICRWLVQGNAEPVNEAWDESLLHFHSFRDNQTHLPRRVFSGHLLPNGIGHENLLGGKIKTLFVYRNPKDSCVSNYNLYRDCPRLCTDPGKFSDFAMDFATDFEHLHSGCWVKTMRAWEEFTDRHPEVPVLPLSYERTVKNVAEEVKRIADFCGIFLSESLLQEITERASIQNMKHMNDLFYYKQYFHENKPTYIRKGQIGDWKNWFTVALNERFDYEIKKRFSGMKYEIIYE